MTRAGRMTLAHEAIDFQNDIDRLLAEPTPLALRLWPYLGALALMALVICAANLRLDVVVVASGRLANDTPQIVLQPMARATLRDLYVRPGDLVSAGQLLARLDATLPEADRLTLVAEAAALGAEKDRLDAELTGGRLLATTADAAFQAEVLRQNDDLAATRRGILQGRIRAIAGAELAEQAAGAGLADRLAIAREIEGMRLELASRQSGSHLATLEAEAGRIDAEAALARHQARLDELAEQRVAAKADLAAFEIDRRRGILEQLGRARLRLAQLGEQLAKADRMAALADLYAPRPGIVLSVAKGGPGSVVGEGEAVVVLVPTDAPLIAEIGIKSSELGAIAPGDTVRLKIDAFPWRKHGTLTGTLTDVSHASFTPEGTVAALHSGHVRLTGTLVQLPAGVTLLPGMTLSAEISAGSRTILDYFLDPLLRGLNESLREP